VARSDRLRKDLKARGFEIARTAVRTGRVVRARLLRPWLLRQVESRNSTDTLNGVTLFWIPEAGVAPHLVAMEILARTLVEEGHRVLFTRCYEGFPRCPVMDMYNLDEPPAADAARSCCDRCLYNSVRMLGTYRLPALDLRPWLDRIQPRLNELTPVRPADPSTFTFEGIPFGLLAMHDLILANKLGNVDDIPSKFDVAWWDRTRSCVTAYLVVTELASSGEISHLVHFNDGALHVSARLAAERAGIPCRSIAFASHMGVDRRKIVVTKTIAHDAMLRHASTWEQWRDIPLSTSAIREVGDDVVRHFTNPGGASHIYSRGLSSNSVDIRDRLGLSGDRRIAVAFTSSLDEDNAARAYRKALGIDGSAVEDSPFPDQLSWLRHIADQISKSEDLQLVVRVHPREDANDREGVRSEHLRLLRAELGKSRDHVHVVWPRDPVSSYDLARIAHLALVSWSSIGLELARAGVPVLATSVGTFHGLPRNEGVAWEPTVTAYYRRLRELTVDGVVLDDVIMAYRFYAMRQLGLTTDVSDLVTTAGYRFLPRWRSPRESKRLVEALVGDLDPGEDSLMRLERQRTPLGDSEERTEVKAQMRRLFELVTIGRDPVEGGRPLRQVEMAAGDRQPRSAAEPGVVAVSGDVVWFVEDGSWRSVDSPMAARLALFGCSDLVGTSG
jgi:hypothetical protein